MGADVEALIVGHLADTLKLQRGAIEKDRQFSEYGVDSVVGIELVNRIGKSLGLKLKTTVLFDYPTVSALAEHVVQQHGASLKGPAAGGAPKPAPRAAVAGSQVFGGPRGGAKAVPARPVAAPPRRAAAPVAPRPAPARAAPVRVQPKAPARVASAEQKPPPAPSPEPATASDVEGMIVGHLADTLKLQRGAIEKDRQFSEYGVDSVVGIELVNRIGKSLGLKLKTTVLFDYPTVSALAEHVVQQHGASLKGPAAGGAPKPAPRAAVAGSQVFGGPRGGAKAVPARPVAAPPRRAAAPVAPRPAPARAAPVRVQPKAPAAPVARRPAPARPPDAPPSAPYRSVIIEEPGTIDDLRIVEVQPTPPGEGEIQIEVRAFSLNFADLLCVKGLYPNMPAYPFTPGLEVSGVVSQVGRNAHRFRVGDEVFGFVGVTMGAHSTVVNTHELAVMRKPANITHEEACSVPSVFLTVYHLFEKAQMKEGEKILIQTAAGGTGLMALQFARRHDAEIFVTAGSPEKLEYLRQQGAHHLINYREEDFKERVLELTGGHGVDVVINTLSGDAIQKGIDVLAPEGRYLEIAMAGLRSARSIDLSHMVENQSFHSVDLFRLLKSNPAKAHELFDVTVRYLEQGIVIPNVGKVYAFDDVREAYRHMEERRNIGKVVVSVPAAGARRAAGETRHPKSPPSGDIAIIGMAGRFANSDDLEQFWQKLAQGESMVREVPRDRWNIDEHYDPDPTNLKKTYSRWGGFMNDIDKLDAMFFNISVQEAELSDPQQRLFLETAWNALEDAGYAGTAKLSKKCGVFAGVAINEYLTSRHPDTQVAAQAFWGNANSVVPARVAYFLDLKGPCVTVDTACSSSLVAVHMACQSLLNGESELAIAGGVFLTIRPNFYVLASNALMLSPDGQCKSFDNQANGFVPGEGVGVVILKPLARAIADGDQIHAVIKGSGCNQSGKTNGISAPSGVAQTELATAVYEQAKIDPDTITFMEAHGTATKLGDMVEVSALTNAFQRSTARQQFCALGSVKSNIGHTAAASGIASMIKAVLALRHRQLPPSLHFKTPNEHVEFESSPFFVNTQLTPWRTAPGQPRRAAVNSFGFSGSNAHLVLEEYVAPERPQAVEPAEPQLIVLSAKSEERLREYARRYVGFLDAILRGDEGRRRPSLADLAYTLQVARAPMRQRLALVVRGLDELRDRLRRFSEGQGDEGGVFISQGGEEGQETPEGMRTLIARKDLDALGRLWVGGATVDWHLLHMGRTRRRVSLPTYPFMKERYWLPEAPPFALMASPPAPVPEARPAPVASSQPSGKPREHWEERVKQVIAKVTRAPLSRIEPGTPFEALGIDSMMAKSIIRDLEQDFGELPVTLMFEHQTPGELVAYLLNTHREATAPAAPSPAMPRPEGEDIAIIGLSGRYPMASNLHDFWENLAAGRNCIQEVPRERWDATQLGGAGRWGGFLSDIDKFDPLFFNIAPTDAAWVDPQERLFLEIVWETLEDAGYTRQALARRQTEGHGVGLFVGCTAKQYPWLAPEPMLGGMLAMSSYWSIANRASYFFDFQGPSVAVDTACSSSLAAICMAVASLQRGECAVAIAGGVNLSLHPSKYLALRENNLLSSEGRSKSFGDSDGYVPGEGVGAVLLKPLSRALADRDHIHGIIKGAGINHGGRSNGYQVPNLKAQAQLVGDVLRRAGVDARTVSYVESAANGSPLGDPIEVGAIAKAFGPATGGGPSCVIGSVKANIGHLEAASGISQLTKVLLQMRHRKIVPSINLETVNPHVKLDGTPFRFQRELTDWSQPVLEQDGGRRVHPRRASVNSFGMGGVNAHLVVEEPPGRPSAPNEGAHAEPVLLVFSAQTPEQVRELMRRMADHVQRTREVSLNDLAYTLQIGREAMEARCSMVVRSREEFLAAVEGATPSIRAAQPDDDLLKSKAGQALLQAALREGDLAQLGKLWERGLDLDWEQLSRGRPVARVSLPTYPFMRQRYWLSGQAPREAETHPTPRREGAAVELVSEAVGRLLGVEPSALSQDKPLVEYGFDSLKAMKLKYELEQGLGQAISMDTLGSSRTIRELTRNLREQIEAGAMRAANGVDRAGGQALKQAFLKEALDPRGLSERQMVELYSVLESELRLPREM